MTSLFFLKQYSMLMYKFIAQSRQNANTYGRFSNTYFRKLGILFHDILMSKRM